MDDLAAHGGEPVRENVLPFVPEKADIGEEEQEEALRVLKSKKLSQLSSEEVKEFEEAFSSYHGVNHAIATNSGTTALHIALAAAELGPGDDVILPPYTFMATANAILHQNLVPNFADINPRTYNLDPDEARERITENTEGIIPVHMLGQPANMDPILETAQEKDLVVIEDACQSIGAEYKGRKVGTMGDMGCFSFYLNKNITSGGEGGMMITDDDKLARKARSIRNHGRVKKSPYPDVPAHNVYTRLGYNYRMTSIQAAVGKVQLEKLDQFNEQRIQNAEYLTDGIEEIQGVEPPHVRDDVKHVYWTYGARVIEDELGITKDEFRELLLEEGIKAEGYCPIPVHLQKVIKENRGYGGGEFPFKSPYYDSERQIEYSEGLCPKAEDLSKKDLLLPVYQTLTKNELNDVIVALEKVTDHI